MCTFWQGKIMKTTQTNIEGLLIIEMDVFVDERGFFIESFQEKRYQEVLGNNMHFVQDNLSQSKEGVLRGLHYQAPPFDMGKLVSVLSGRVLDVAVDIRFGSPTFGQHVAVELSAENHKQLWIPSGFAHGFVTLDDDTLFAYKCTNVYSKEHDRGVRWNDPVLGIAWGVENPIVSEKDQKHPILANIPQEFYYK
jgi:dTDP-4-dehydrorhamnose 3,5-epimerase